MTEEAVLHLFASSPNDVQAERERMDLVLERPNAEFAGRVRANDPKWSSDQDQGWTISRGADQGDSNGGSGSRAPQTIATAVPRHGVSLEFM
jgi:hypothetical protein